MSYFGCCLWSTSDSEQCEWSLFQFPAAVTDNRSVFCITYLTVQQLNKRNQITAAGEVADGKQRWLMGNIGGWQYLLSCCPLQIIIVSLRLLSSCLQISVTAAADVVRLTFHRPSEVLWHLRDSTLRRLASTQTQTETGAAGGQTSDQCFSGNI